MNGRDVRTTKTDIADWAKLHGIDHLSLEEQRQLLRQIAHPFIPLQTTQELFRRFNRKHEGPPEQGGERVHDRQPYFRLLRLAQWVVSPSTYTFVLEPTLSDLAEEHVLALAVGRLWKARRVRLRGYWSFWMAAAAHLLAVVGRRVARFWERRPG